ncbi:MAG: tRNA (adenosine(37)-N6)-threonylcarbamoyltransferase complex dimerization subunit type 1 TsaB [Gammaproteobacteria bacterium]|nr:tRNA (adenosine(37)-N6)-threonylcarbamoyltransferase complex dimerization subunit type 1 TsaB [Gammaproteobacteria bacterium]MDE0512810.1 tRNA (adenosine(37)-N6)-threonylcarbamoyltransferase complex dimerization subunit type 1 TsaB [Gammaproteobacteria bacterium]
MNILALDTATEACSAALLCDGSVYERHDIAPRRHAELILPMVDAVLAQAGLGLDGLDAIAFGRGPGAFTGVRIAAGVTQGLALGAGLPVIPVSSLAALAQPALGNAAVVLPAIDARMGEVYWAAYDSGQDGLAAALVDEQVALPDAVRVPSNRQIFGVGSGWGTYRERLERVLHGRLSGIDPERFPLAKNMLPLAVREYNKGRCVSPEQALPVYLRDNVVKQV